MDNIEEIKKHWTYNIVYEPSGTYAFVFSENMKELGFYRSDKVWDESILEKVTNKAVEKYSRLQKTIEKNKMKQPSLLDEENII